MSSGRVPGHGLERGHALRMRIDGEEVDAYEGESIAAAVMADRGLELRETDQRDPRGYFCGMGVCFDCVMIVDDVPNTRTCITFVRDGMTVEHQVGASSADAPAAPTAH
jgi:predicted molibdopterin-dependent oxidoreductase YjgC